MYYQSDRDRRSERNNDIVLFFPSFLSIFPTDDKYPFRLSGERYFLAIYCCICTGAQ